MFRARVKSLGLFGMVKISDLLGFLGGWPPLRATTGFQLFAHGLAKRLKTTLCFAALSLVVALTLVLAW